MQLAPVLVLVYTRKKHFIDCIESLSRCRLANQTHLFIASDAAKTEADEEAVKDIRNYCAGIEGFRKVELIANEENLGVDRSFNNARAIIFQEYDRLIFTEDDNVFSPNFLEFINDGLEYYKDNAYVFSICGYTFPFQMPKKCDSDVFSSTFMSGWGFGVWKEKFLAVDFYPKHLDKSLRHKKRVSYTLIYLMYPVLKDNSLYGDVLMEYHCLKNDMVNIFPKISLVQSHGFDGSGLNTGINPKFSSQEICSEKKVFKFIDDITIQPDIENRYIDAVDFPFTNATEKIFLKIIQKIWIMIRIVLTTMQFSKWPRFMQVWFLLITKRSIVSDSRYKRLLDNIE